MSIISYRLDLVISLIDTTTGRLVEERNARFYKDGELLKPEHREEGLYILLNTGRENFTLSAEVTGYEMYHGQVNYEELDENQPFYTVYLLPKEDTRTGEPVLSYQDRIPKLEVLEAITLLKPRCAASEYNARKKELAVFWMDGNKDMPDVHYGLLQGQKDTYTHIEVEQVVSAARLKLVRPLEEEFRVNAPIYRIIFGQVNEKGNFLLRVRDSADEIPVIIRYRKNKEWYTLKSEFHSLTKGAFKKAKKSETKGEDTGEK